MAILSSVVDFLFPRQCHVCGATLGESERYVCASCLARLPRTGYHCQKDNPMERRFMGIVPYDSASGYFFYKRNSEIASLVHDMKYRHFPGLARYLGELMGKELYTTGFISDIDAIIPVPIFWTKRARRGYNQCEEMAKGLSESTGIPVMLNLKARRPHRTQTSLTLEERMRNTENVFALNNAHQLAGKKILLLDDVCTTGTTLISAANVLTHAAPGCELSILTLCVTF